MVAPQPPHVLSVTCVTAMPRWSWRRISYLLQNAGIDGAEGGMAFCLQVCQLTGELFVLQEQLPVLLAAACLKPGEIVVGALQGGLGGLELQHGFQLLLFHGGQILL